MKNLTLIHTALLSEAQSIIEKYKLKKVNSNPKIYTNDNIVVLIGGIGQTNTIKALEFVFENYNINRALNIGIAGCNDKSIDIGELFCTNRQLEDIKFIKLKTVDNPKLPINIPLSTTLYDMEAKYFEDMVSKYIEDENIYIFKVVSDHLDDTIPSKEMVKQLIRNNLGKIEKQI